MRRTRRLTATLIAAVAALALIPASASALGLANLSAAPDTTQAGTYTNFNIHMEFTGSGANGQVKDLTVGLPAGEVGDPNATPKCTVAQLNSSTGTTDGCAPNTQVGTVSVQARLLALVPVTVNGKLYNLEPNPGEPARFGIVLHPDPLGVTAPIILQSAVQLRTSDFGLNTIINNIPNTTLASGDTTILSQTITLFGVAPTGKPFIRNPTSCHPATTTFSGVDHAGGSASGQASFTPTGCGNLDFSPTFTARVGGPGQNGPGRVPTTVTTSIDQDSTEAGLLRAQVAVPANDLVADPSLLGNQCDPAAFLASACPPSTIVGSALAASPLLSQPLSGNVVLVSNGSPIPDIGLDLNGQLHLLLRGTQTLSEVVTFDGLPDIPIAHFQLSFGPSPGLLTANRNLCNPPAPLFHANFTGYNGAATAVDSAATVDGCGALQKCKKAKKKHKRRAADAKKHKKRSCKKKKHKKHRK
jgi:hypothetical protein